MLPNNFYVKKQRGTWTEDEIEKILNLIENEALADYYMTEIMKKEEESKEPNISLDEFKSRMGWL